MWGVRAPGKCLQKDMDQRDEGSPGRGEHGSQLLTIPKGEVVGLPTYSISTSKPTPGGRREASSANIPQVLRGQVLPVRTMVTLILLTTGGERA